MSVPAAGVVLVALGYDAGLRVQAEDGGPAASGPERRLSADTGTRRLTTPPAID